jgi:hypothetical protein
MPEKHLSRFRAQHREHALSMQISGISYFLSQSSDDLSRESPRPIPLAVDVLRDTAFGDRLPAPAPRTTRS